MGLKDRILKYIAYKGLEKAQFEKKCGLSNDSVRKMSDNTRIGTLDKISKSFPELNINWVRTGEGAMLLNVEDNIDFTDEFEMKEIVNESKNDYNPPKGDVVLSREVFEQISRLTEIVLSQQRTIELMQREKVKRDARMEEDATCADVAGSDIGR